MTKLSLHSETLAKPSGITLAQHTADVVAEAAYICEMMPSTMAKYNEITHKNLANRLRVAAEYHDIGKVCSLWQEACLKDYQAYLQWEKQHGRTDFCTYSKSVGQEAGQYLRKSGVRHEFYSLLKANETNMPTPLLAAIAAHHSKLSFSSEERWKGFLTYWRIFKSKSNELLDDSSLKLEVICKYIFEYNGLRSLLQLADHRASAKESNDYVAEIQEFHYVFPFAQKRGIQKIVEAEWDKDMLLVRAPTGAGKTDAALLWASKQIEANRADRLIIAMPTRFTANALAINVSESLSGTGLYHSSAWYGKYKDIKDGTTTQDEALASHKMAKQLVSPVTVTTIDHLLMSLTQTREDQRMVNFNLANSCLVIDEADFYDDFSLANIQFLLRVLKHWDVPVLVMSASIPDSALSFYQGTGYNIQSILEDTKINRSTDKFEVKQIRTYEAIEEFIPLLQEFLKRGHGILYLNTVDKAIEAYELINRIKNEEGYDVPIILYHSRFTEPDKAEKERLLLEALGKDAWNNGRAHGIAILTQIGEISINISTDIMATDLCPIDRLMQRVGRLCRFDKSRGELHVFIPQKDQELYPAPYGCYNQKNKHWCPSIALLNTIDCIHEGAYSETDMLNALNTVYASDMQISDSALNNAMELQESFKDNWLINPMEKHNIDDGYTNFWKSRDIGTQDVVYTEVPDNVYFPNYSDFMSFQLQKSLALPMYLFGKIRNKLDMKEVYIANETKKIHIIREGLYNSEIGLKTSEDKDSNFL